MLNVYISLLDIKDGFPTQSQAKLMKYRELGSRSEAFAAIIEDFSSYVAKQPSSVFSQHSDNFMQLIGMSSSKASTGASMVVGDQLLLVTTKSGSECELVARRGY